MADDPTNGVKAGIDAVRGPTASVDGVPPSVLTTARNIALQSGGNTAAVSDFMRQQGYPQHAGEWCGDFVSAVVHASGGTPPPASPVAGAWANFGSPRQGAPQPGDIAIKRGYDARTGSNYTHVTFVDSVNSDGTFVGLGGNQGGGLLTRSPFNTSEFDFRNPMVGPGTGATKGLDLPGDAPNAGQYQPLINAAAAKYNISPTWLGRLIYQESLFKPNATSPAGAQGIAQFMPATAARYGVNVNDPGSSIDGAAHYLSDNLKLFNGNVGLATAGYNWGENKVQDWIAGKGKPPPNETINYVQDITGHSINDWKAQPAGAPSTAAPSTAPATPGTTINTSGLAAGAGSGALPGFGTKQASDDFLAGLKKAGITPNQGNQAQDQQPDIRPSPIMSGPGLRNASSPQSIGMQAAQLEPQLTGYSPGLYGQSLNSQPLAWSTNPIGPPAWMKAAGPQGQQGLGTSLNSLQMASGLSPQQLQMMMNPMMLDQGGGYG